MTTNFDYIECPYCGEDNGDINEFDSTRCCDDEKICICIKCEQQFDTTMEISITYHTSK